MDGRKKGKGGSIGEGFCTAGAEERQRVRRKREDPLTGVRQRSRPQEDDARRMVRGAVRIY